MTDKPKQPDRGVHILDEEQLDNVTGGTAALPPKTTSFAESGKKGESVIDPTQPLGFAESGKKGES